MSAQSTTVEPVRARDHKLEALCRKIIETAACPLPRASTLPPAAYTDEDYFKHEVKHVLEAGWMCVAHVSQLKEAGSFVAIDLFNEPLLVTRDSGGGIRVLSRVCAHRGMDIMPEGFDYPREGTAKRLVCPYHRWAYDLDGKLAVCPQMQKAEDFRRDDWKLAAFRSEVWHGFVFVNMDGLAPPLSEQFADFSQFVARWKPEEMEVVIALDWECDFNWKVMIENWMESYHHIGIHSETLNPAMPGQDTWSDPEHPHFVKAHLPFKQSVKESYEAAFKAGGQPKGFKPIAGLSPSDQVEWALYVGYPCFMFLTTHDRVIWYRLLPQSAGRCKLHTMTLISRDAAADPEIGETIKSETEMLIGFHTEDMLVNTAMQRGLQSRTVVQGRLSHLEEPVWLIQRYIAARLQGTYPERALRRPYAGPLAAAE